MNMKKVSNIKLFIENNILAKLNSYITKKRHQLNLLLPSEKKAIKEKFKNLTPKEQQKIVEEFNNECEYYEREIGTKYISEEYVKNRIDKWIKESKPFFSRWKELAEKTNDIFEHNEEIKSYACYQLAKYYYNMFWIFYDDEGTAEAQYKNSRKWIDKAVELNQNDPKFWYLRHILCKKMNDPKEAYRSLKMLEKLGYKFDKIIGQ